MVPSMGITNNHNFLSNTDTSDDPLEKIVDKYKNHLSITYINTHITSPVLLHFNLLQKIRLVI